MSQKIIETAGSRIVEGRVFNLHPPGSQGSPPPEMQREVDEENARLEREALTAPFENPIATMQRDMDESSQFEALVSPFEGSIWIEKNPPANTEKLKFELKNFFRGLRPNVMGEATLRDEFLIRVAAIPFHEYLPEPPRVSTHAGRKRVWEVPATTKPTRETFPLAFFTLSEFLKTHKPENGADISILETLSKPDVGFEHEARVEAPTPPTMTELMQLLANALKPQKATP